MRPMSKGAMETIFYTVPPGICFMDAGASLIIAQVVLALCITSGPVQVWAAENRKISLEPRFFLPVIANSQLVELASSPYCMKASTPGANYQGLPLRHIQLHLHASFQTAGHTNIQIMHSQLIAKCKIG